MQMTFFRLSAGLLMLALGASQAAAFSEQTLGGSGNGGAAQFQDTDDLLKGTPFDVGTTTEYSSDLTTKKAPTSPDSGFSFSVQGPQNNLGNNAQPFGPWTIGR